MACMLYVRFNGTDIRLGSFKDRAAAEEYFLLWRDNKPVNFTWYPEPIYVETGKGKRKK